MELRLEESCCSQLCFVRIRSSKVTPEPHLESKNWEAPCTKWETEQQFQAGIATCATAFGEKHKLTVYLKILPKMLCRSCFLSAIKWGFPADSQCMIWESGFTDAYLTFSQNCCSYLISLQPVLLNTLNLCCFLSHNVVTLSPALTGSTNSHCNCPTPGQAFPSRKKPCL